ncbi:uncharacterized protein LOC117786420 [Drosophila innubila]|uniref:uncharacterized protein LOC117786420 n=1 Tax=Drosophila innubila TaxID=198719 RepID=UPI00148DFAA4|nr:uncharacterized protein LOC117786420 [Drosophila innubila]
MSAFDGITNEYSALHKALIDFATTSCRLLFIQDDSVYEDFKSISSEFDDLSEIELKAIVLNDILPRIHTYQLTETVKKRLKLLDLHPGFKKTTQGYQYAALHNEASFVLTPSCDFSHGEQLPQLLSEQGNRRAEKEFRLKAPTRGEDASHTVLFDPGAVTHATPKFQPSSDIAILLSIMVSTDLELSSAQLHDLQVIQSRLRSAKQSFEDNGRMLPYRNNLEHLNHYIDLFAQLKTKLCRALNSFY